MSKCPSCGYDNPPDALYCEECDWRLDRPYRKPKERNPFAFSVIALIIGIVSVALLFVNGAAYGSVLIGAAGLVVGSYSVNLPRYLNPENKTLCMAMAGAGAFLSIIGFIAGLGAAAGAF